MAGSIQSRMQHDSNKGIDLLVETLSKRLLSHGTLRRMIWDDDVTEYVYVILSFWQYLIANCTHTKKNSKPQGLF